MFLMVGLLSTELNGQRKLPTKKIAMQYVRHVQAKYGLACVIFDGYEQGPSLKDHEHQRRVTKTCADIQLSESMEARVEQQIFLANEHNKSQFITLLSHYLQENSQIVGQSIQEMLTE